MIRKLLLVAALLAACLFALLLSPGTAGSERLQEVLVTNFPSVQAIRGEVEVEGTVRHAVLERREEVVVPPVGRGEGANLVPGGMLQSDGFTTVVLSLQGEVKDTVFAPGEVGAVLIPDEEPVMRALRDSGLLQFPLEVRAALAPGETSGFSSPPTVQALAFPRYRIYFFNSGNRSVEANLYLYLRN